MLKNIRDIKFLFNFLVNFQKKATTIESQKDSLKLKFFIYVFT